MEGWLDCEPNLERVVPNKNDGLSPNLRSCHKLVVGVHGGDDVVVFLKESLGEFVLVEEDRSGRRVVDKLVAGVDSNVVSHIVGSYSVNVVQF